MAAGFQRLSPQSRYRRFFGPMTRLSARDLDWPTTGSAAGSADSCSTCSPSARSRRTSCASALPSWPRTRRRSRCSSGWARPRRRAGGASWSWKVSLTAPESSRGDLLSILRELAAGTLAPTRTLVALVLPPRIGPPEGGARVSSARMADGGDPLDRLSSAELHDLAVSHARRHLDVRFFWELLKVLPAAEAGAGELDEAQADVMSLSGHVDDLTDSGRGEVAELLRPFYLDYLRRNEVEA